MIMHCMDDRARTRRSLPCALFALALVAVSSTNSPNASSAVERAGQKWIGTWATAPQFSGTTRVETYRNQSLRLIVHTSAAGRKARIKISNVFGDQPLEIGGAHIARRTNDAEIDPASDRTLMFRGQPSTTVPVRSTAVSDAVDLDVPALSDLAISVFLPRTTAATTVHTLALQTNYVSPETGDSTAEVRFPVAKTIAAWPFLTGVDVTTSSLGAAIVAFGSSTTDGDGSTQDANRRWPDVLAERLQKAGGGTAELGVLNLGIIGNRLLTDIHSPRQAGGPFGAVLDQLGPRLGDAGLARFDRDVLAQAGVRYVILALGINDILFPGSFIPASESVSAHRVIAGHRQLIARAHKKGIRVLVTTIPPFEDALFERPAIRFSTPGKEQVRQEVNAWIRSSGECDGVIDFDAVVRDPGHPARLLPGYDSGDHLHVNDVANVAQGDAIPLTLFRDGKTRSPGAARRSIIAD
jgi:lysophospholipase L1-like esterase